jgi:hypothetical protein
MNQSSEAINKVSKCYYYATLAAITAPSSGRRLHRSFFLLHMYYIHHQNNKRTQKQRIGIPSLESLALFPKLPPPTRRGRASAARVRQRRDGDDDDGSREVPSMSLDVHLHPVVNVRRCEAV